MSEDGAVGEDTGFGDDPFAYYVPPDAVGEWLPPQPPGESVEEALRRHLTAFLAPALLLPLLGAPVALLWRAVTPRVAIARTASGPVPTASESNQFFAIDGWFVVVTFLVGVALGAVAWRFLRRRSPAAPAGMALGATLASAVTAVVGARLVVDEYLHGYCRDLVCSIYDGTLHLRMPGAVMAWPFGMLLSFVALTLVSERES